MEVKCNLTEDGSLVVDLNGVFLDLPIDEQTKLAESMAVDEYVIEAVVAQLVSGFTPRHSYNCFSTGKPYYERWRKALLDQADDVVQEMVREILARREQQEQQILDLQAWGQSARSAYFELERGNQNVKFPPTPKYVIRAAWTKADAAAVIAAETKEAKA